MTEWPIKYTLQGGRKSQGNVFRQRKQCRVKTCAVQHLQLYTKHFARSPGGLLCAHTAHYFQDMLSDKASNPFQTNLPDKLLRNAVVSCCSLPSLWPTSDSLKQLE